MSQPNLPDDGVLAGQRPRRKARRGTAILPSLLTVANLGMGWYAIQQANQALVGTAHAAQALDAAAKAIGWAILLDGFDGRIARMVHASSDFGREFDSLADVISFGVAPALLAYVWGVRFVVSRLRWQGHPVTMLLENGLRLAVFLFMVAGAARLARFNIATTESKPSNPGKPGKKYFVGMPIPAGAGVIAALIHAFPAPITNPLLSLAWVALVLLVAYFMVSTWRFYSFKEINLRRRHPFVIVILIAALIGVIFLFSRPFLLAVATVYAAFGIFWRLQHWTRRRSRPATDGTRYA